MTLVSDIIRDAYRESNINAIGVSPTAAQSDEALRILNRIVGSVFGNEEGDPLTPLPLGNNHITRPGGFPAQPNNNWYVPLNARLMLNLTQATTIYLNPAPQDGSRFAIVDTSNNLATFPLTIVGNGRQIDSNLQETINTSGYTGEWMYRDDLGNWMKITPLAATDQMPFPSSLDDYFIVGLAMRLNPRNGAPIDPQSVEAYKKALNDLRTTYKQIIQIGSEMGIVRTPGTWPNRYYGGQTGTDLFNSGYPFFSDTGWGY